MADGTNVFKDMPKSGDFRAALSGLGARLAPLEDRLIRQRLESQVHIFENPQTGGIFLKESLTIYSCPKPLKKAMEEFLRGASRRDACRKNGLAAADFESFLHFLFDKIEAPAVSNGERKTETRALDRLVVNISQSCNLRCRYCYAGGGTYGGSTAVMSPRTALKILDSFFPLFDAVHHVQFFGGEPLLNPEILRLFCAEAERRVSAGAIKSLPDFTVVTNGTIFSEEILGLLKKHKVGVTVSLDGPEAIQNYLRGAGSYAKVVRFIHRLEKERIAYSFETTYTGHHLEQGVTPKDLLVFFHRRFQHQEVHMPTVSLSSGHLLAVDEAQEARLYREAVEYSLQHLNARKSSVLGFAARIADVYLHKRPIAHYCAAGFSTLSVDTAGDVYPCFMFIGRPDFRFGNIFEEDFPAPRTTRRAFQAIQDGDKPHNPICAKCWASPFCSGCVGHDYIRSGGTLKKTGCAVTKAMVEGFLSRAVMLGREAVPSASDHGFSP